MLRWCALLLARRLPSTASAGVARSNPHRGSPSRLIRDTTFVRQLRRYYTPVRLPVFVHHWLASLDFPMRPAVPCLAGKHGLSRFSREVMSGVGLTLFLCMQRVSDRAGSPGLLPDRDMECGLPLVGTASAPRTRDFAAQWLACTYPCQRFTPALTGDRT